MEMQNMSGFGINDCLTEAGVGWNCFGTYNKDRKICTFSNKNVREFVRESVKGEKVTAFSRSFESNQYEKIVKTIKKHLKRRINENSEKVDE